MIPALSFDSLPQDMLFSLDSLPQDMLFEVLDYLSIKEVSNQSSVSHSWKVIALNCWKRRTNDDNFALLNEIRKIAALSKAALFDTRFSYQHSADPLAQFILTNKDQIGFYSPMSSDLILYQGRDMARTQPLRLERIKLLNLNWRELFILQGRFNTTKLEIFNLQKACATHCLCFDDEILYLFPVDKNNYLSIFQGEKVVLVNRTTNEKKVLFEAGYRHLDATEDSPTVNNVLKIGNFLGFETSQGCIFVNWITNEVIARRVPGDKLHLHPRFFFTHNTAKGQFEALSINENKLELAWSYTQTDYKRMQINTSWVVLSKPLINENEKSICVLDLSNWKQTELTLPYPPSIRSKPRFEFIQDNIFFFGIGNRLEMLFLPTKTPLTSMTLPSNLDVVDVIISEKDLLILAHDEKEGDYRILQSKLAS